MNSRSSRQKMTRGSRSVRIRNESKDSEVNRNGSGNQKTNTNYTSSDENPDFGNQKTNTNYTSSDDFGKTKSSVDAVELQRHSQFYEENDVPESCWGDQGPLHHRFSTRAEITTLVPEIAGYYKDLDKRKEEMREKKKSPIRTSEKTSRIAEVINNFENELQYSQSVAIHERELERVKKKEVEAFLKFSSPSTVSAVGKFKRAAKKGENSNKQVMDLLFDGEGENSEQSKQAGVHISTSSSEAINSSAEMNTSGKTTSPRRLRLPSPSSIMNGVSGIWRGPMYVKRLMLRQEQQMDYAPYGSGSSINGNDQSVPGISPNTESTASVMSRKLFTTITNSIGFSNGLSSRNSEKLQMVYKNGIGVERIPGAYKDGEEPGVLNGMEEGIYGNNGNGAHTGNNESRADSKLNPFSHVPTLLKDLNPRERALKFLHTVSNGGEDHEEMAAAKFFQKPAPDSRSFASAEKGIHKLRQKQKESLAHALWLQQRKNDPGLKLFKGIYFAFCIWFFFACFCLIFVGQHYFTDTVPSFRDAYIEHGPGRRIAGRFQAFLDREVFDIVETLNHAVQLGVYREPMNLLQLELLLTPLLQMRRGTQSLEIGFTGERVGVTTGGIIFRRIGPHGHLILQSDLYPSCRSLGAFGCTQNLKIPQSNWYLRMKEVNLGDGTTRTNIDPLWDTEIVKYASESVINKKNWHQNVNPDEKKPSYLEKTYPELIPLDQRKFFQYVVKKDLQRMAGEDAFNITTAGNTAVEDDSSSYWKAAFEDCHAGSNRLYHTCGDWCPAASTTSSTSNPFMQSTSGGAIMSSATSASVDTGSSSDSNYTNSTTSFTGAISTGDPTFLTVENSTNSTMDGSNESISGSSEAMSGSSESVSGASMSGTGSSSRTTDAGGTMKVVSPITADKVFANISPFYDNISYDGKVVTLAPLTENQCPYVYENFPPYLYFDFLPELDRPNELYFGRYSSKGGEEVLREAMETKIYDQMKVKSTTTTGSTTPILSVQAGSTTTSSAKATTPDTVTLSPSSCILPEVLPEQLTSNFERDPMLFTQERVSSQHKYLYDQRWIRDIYIEYDSLDIVSTSERQINPWITEGNPNYGFEGFELSPVLSFVFKLPMPRFKDRAEFSADDGAANPLKMRVQNLVGKISIDVTKFWRELRDTLFILNSGGKTKASSNEGGSSSSSSSSSFDTTSSFSSADFPTLGIGAGTTGDQTRSSTQSSMGYASTSIPTEGIENTPGTADDAFSAFIVDQFGRVVCSIAANQQIEMKYYADGNPKLGFRLIESIEGFEDVKPDELTSLLGTEAGDFSSKLLGDSTNRISILGPIMSPSPSLVGTLLIAGQNAIKANPPLYKELKPHEPDNLNIRFYVVVRAQADVLRETGTFALSIMIMILGLIPFVVLTCGICLALQRERAIGMRSEQREKALEEAKATLNAVNEATGGD